MKTKKYESSRTYIYKKISEFRLYYAGLTLCKKVNLLTEKRG